MWPPESQCSLFHIFIFLFVFSCCRIFSMLRRWLSSVSITAPTCSRPTNGMRRLSSDGVSKEKPGHESTRLARTAWVQFMYTSLVKLTFVVYCKVFLFQIEYAVWTLEREDFNFILCKSFTSPTLYSVICFK